MCLRVESRDVAGRAELDLSRGKADDTRTQTRGCFLGCDHVEFSQG